MILVELLIENYKQYAGEHRIAVPSDATVGIIGANGVGKTTLFEAIEWCLYNPLGIRNEQVRPRGLASHTKVAVTMDRSETGERFVVERELKRAGVSAAIYRVADDGSETVVVQGTRQVSDYVATRLIGLGHAAFVSTFFTRQKELSFFGHLGETERRREVGRLLGLETIRAAQERINDERKQAKAEADSLRRQYEDQSHGRDFASELDAASALIAVADTQLGVTDKCVAAATVQLAEADARRHHWQQRKDEDAALLRDLVAVEGKLHAAAQRAQLREGELEHLAMRERERENLHPVAAAEPQHAAAMAEQDAQRERFWQHQQLRRELERLTRERDSHVRDLELHVLSVTLTERVEGWTWSMTDTAAPLEALVRLRAALASIDLATADAWAEALLLCQAAEKEHKDRSDTYTRYRQVRSGLEAEQQVILASGDPVGALVRIEERRQETQAALNAVNAIAIALRAERDQIDELLRNLRQSRFEDVCPTCARPFAVGEEQLVIDSLSDRRAARDQALADALREAKAAQQGLRDLDGARKDAEVRLSDLQRVLARLEASDPHLFEAEGHLRTAGTALDTALTNAGLDQPPARTAVVQATARAALFRALDGKADGLVRLDAWLRKGDAEREDAASTLAALGEVRYDAARHQQVAGALRRARDAVAALTEIERELTRRPALAADLAAVQADVARLREECDRVERARAELAFDAAALAQAVADEVAAQTAERAAREARHAALLAHRDATQRRDALHEAQERVAQLAARADCRGRDADELDVMVREFNAFEKYVAGRYGPILAETTSELVGQVTDGRYDRVEFDESYGIEVYDGDDEKFPLATFSGGERDAIALCARLALSRMVGSQAVSPPSFLVLDEVFGSLDRDRRARLLDLLGSLAGATEQVHQLFVISHVDDVREAPVFDEVWRIEESAEGVSQIANATRVDVPSGEAE